MTDVNPSEFTEDVTPEYGAIFDVAPREKPPQNGLPFPKTRRVPGTHDQETRKQIALIILSLIAIYYAAILWCFLAGWIDTAKFTAAIAGISGIQALAAAAIGFYYGAKQE